MGIYVNPSLEKLSKAKKKRYYVDKSMIISKLNEIIDSNDAYICVSRPRRFGKTMAANMIVAYYSKGCDSHEIFSDLEISKDPSFEEYINKYTVIKIDMNGIVSRKGKVSVSEYINQEIVAELRKYFPLVVIGDDFSLSEAIQQIYIQTGEKFVFVIDEYDVIMRDELYSSELKDYLRLLISLFKSSTTNIAISLAYLTGILPIIKDKTQSGLNNITEYSMISPKGMAPYMGFTEDEVKKLCDKVNMDFAELKRWYDGYKLNGLEIYSPKSVIEAIEHKCCDSYWALTGTYISIRDLIRMDFEGIEEDVIKLISGGRVEFEPRTFNNTMSDIKCKNDVFTCLVHLGYLGFNRVDSYTKECFIPNHEIRKEWVLSIEDLPSYSKTMSFVRSSRELLKATWEKDEEAVSKMVEKTHMEVTSNLTYNNEGSFSSAIRLAYFYADSYYKVVNELPAGKGYADIAFIPYVKDVPAMIVELKKDKTANTG
ncbi:AAA family ATPase, partial [Bullifex sp.]|uniref:AAA family ATPase n=1 Tax=Bullifex sp. TaxID=2815808 RepID=UPI002A81B08D